jgi:hypothetical protein
MVATPKDPGVQDQDGNLEGAEDHLSAKLTSMTEQAIVVALSSRMVLGIITELLNFIKFIRYIIWRILNCLSVYIRTSA